MPACSVDEKYAHTPLPSRANAKYDGPSISTSASRLNRIVNVSAPTSGWIPAHATPRKACL